MKQIVLNHEKVGILRNAPLIRHLCGHDLPLAARTNIRSRPTPPQLLRTTLSSYPAIGNVDLAVLRPEAQNPTHVTPLIAKLAAGLFRENLVVVGPPPQPLNPSIAQQEAKRRRAFLLACTNGERNRTKEIDFPRNERLREIYWKAVKISGTVYRVCCVTFQCGRVLRMIG